MSAPTIEDLHKGSCDISHHNTCAGQTLVSVRRVYVRLASGFALKELCEQAQRVLRALPREAA